MNETIPTTTSPTGQVAPDDVWGVHRPPALSAQGAGHDTGGTTGPAPLDRGFANLTRAPLRRDTAHGVVGGVCAGIAQRVGVSPAAVRVAVVALALFFGTGVGAYLIAWALLPDESGRTHAEQAVRQGRPGSLAVVGLGSVALLGALAWALGSWPLLLAMAVVALVVAKRTGHLLPHGHG